MRALQLAGMSERIPKAYTRGVRLLVDCYGKTPGRITELEVGDYFLRRRNVYERSPTTLTITWSGVKFYFEKTIKPDRHSFPYLRSQRERQLLSIPS